MIISKVFGAEATSTWQLFCQTGEGFYIPPYQREYSWSSDNIRRLFDDVGHGLQMLVNSDDAITFLGTIIVIHDTKYETVEPQVKDQLPGKVKVVIDGQQRLTTLLLINACLHDEIEYRAYQIRRDEARQLKWLRERSIEVSSSLRKTYEQDMDYGDDEFRWYPRIIRSYIDSWSRFESSVKYDSPIARFLHEYVKHTRGSKPQSYFKCKVECENDADKARHAVIEKNVRLIGKTLKAIAQGGHADAEFPALKEISDTEHFQTSLMNARFSADVRQLLEKDAESKKEQRFCELLRLLLFSKFLLERVGVTLVTAEKEVYAFDMFEALNTTGEPLTAFETFRPLVINAEGLPKYDNSPSRKLMAHVEDYVDAFKDSQKKQKATSGLLVPFALAETGKKLSKRLSDQRIFLRDQYERLGSLEKRREFVRHLAHTAMFVKDAWPEQKGQEPVISAGEFNNEPLLKMCLAVLNDAKHDIVIAPLVRFFSHLRLASAEDIESASQQMEEAVRATIAFFVLWRSSRRSTENIDSYYRALMREGLATAEVEPLARRPDDNEDCEMKPRAEGLRNAFRHILHQKGGIHNSDDWVKRSRDLDIYKNSTIAKFLLFLSTHDTTDDPDNPGLSKESREEVLSMLTFETWAKKQFWIEHIAPQARPHTGWDDSIYEEPSTVHCIGNLLLVPGRENASIQNRPWEQKRLIYKLLASQSIDELDELMSAAQKQGVELSTSTKDIIKEAKYLPHVKAVSNVDSEWNVELISKRSENLLQLAWRRLAPWLGLPSK